MPELVDRRTPLSATLPEDDGLTRECSLNELGTGAHVGEDPWASAPTQEGDVIGSILDNQKGLACPKGHTLIEVSLMCDICHGKSNSGLTTGNSPVLFCKQCQSLICFSCIQDVSKSCLQEHDVVVCRLFCDRCNYQTPYAVEKRRDPADNTFKTRKKFTVNPTDEEWEACERYVPNSQEFYGCKKCDYDICTKCYSNRLNKNTSASVVVRGSRVHILSFRVDSTRNETILHQLANQARIAIPAVLNFLYLKRTTKRACLYFGRYDECGKTVGVGSSNMRNSDEFPEQLRNEFLKIMMHEIWPPLRVDSPSGNKPLGFVLQSDMQALLWIKKISTGRCYVKLILQNIPYLYFDNVRPGQDKYRWKNRRLHVRRLDNLETEKAVESYEVYFQSLKTACKWAHAYYKEKGPRHVDGKVTVTKGDKLYSFAERLYDEEDSSLDYKSYWVDPLGELLSNVPKFMTGFANAYGKGKLLVGVMEVHKYELLKQPQVKGKWWKTFRDTYVPDKWIDGPSQDGRVALVLGLSISNREVAALVKGLTQSFKSCIPPLPPSWVSIRLHPTKPPQPWVNFCGTGVGVIFYTNEAFESERVVGGLRAKAHRVLRTLLPYGLVLVQIPDKNIPREHLPGHITSTQSILYYVVVRGDGNQAGPRSYAAEQCGEQMPGSPLTKPEWREKIDGYKMEGYAVVELNEIPAIPQLYVIEVAIDRNDTLLVKPKDPQIKKTLFFTGWPSIPVWDEVNDEVAKIAKDLKLLDRKRMKIKVKHGLMDPAVLQRICSCMKPIGKCRTLSMGSKEAWLPLLRLRGISKSFCMAADAALGISAFDWVASEHIMEENIIPVQLVTSYNTPPVLQMFFSRVGDIPMPFPYVLALPSRANKPFMMHHMSRKPVLVAPVLRVHCATGLSDYLSIALCVKTSKLMVVDQQCSKLLGVTDVFIEPSPTKRAHHLNGSRMVGGFSIQSDVECESENCMDAVWDLPFFMSWYRSLVRDSLLPLTFVDQCFAIDPAARAPFTEGGVSRVPQLCTQHMPPNVDGILSVSEHSCDWHEAEKKWMRNKTKLWRL